MIIFDFKRDAFLRETIVYSPAPSTKGITTFLMRVVIFLFYIKLYLDIGSNSIPSMKKAYRKGEE